MVYRSKGKRQQGLLMGQLPLPEGRGLQLVVSPLRLLTGSLATIRSTEGSDISGGIQISIDLEAATLELEGLRHCVFDAIQLEMLWFASL